MSLIVWLIGAAASNLSLFAASWFSSSDSVYPIVCMDSFNVTVHFKQSFTVSISRFFVYYSDFKPSCFLSHDLRVIGQNLAIVFVINDVIFKIIYHMFQYPY